VAPVFIAVVTAAVAGCENPRNQHIPSFSHSWEASQEGSWCSAHTVVVALSDGYRAAALPDNGAAKRLVVT
jgi:hypothetical protein